MPHDEKKRDKILRAIVITISLAGILFFGYRAVREATERSKGNPFEYNIDNFKNVDPSLPRYREVSRIPVGQEEVFGIASGSDDRIYVSGSEAILVLDREGRQQDTIPVDEPVLCLSVDRSGDIYAGTIDHVEIYRQEGREKTKWPSLGEEAIITSIAISEDHVYVADAGNLTVWKFSEDGEVEHRIGDRDESRDIPGFIIPSPYFDVAVDPDGFLWAANTGRHSLENYTEDGDFRTSWGEAGMRLEEFGGCCNPSHFTILEDGSFVTSEKGIVRIKISNRLGEPVSLVAGPDQFLEGTVGLDLAADSSRRILVLDPAQKLVRVFEELAPNARKSR